MSKGDSIDSLFLYRVYKKVMDLYKIDVSYEEYYRIISQLMGEVISVDNVRNTVIEPYVNPTGPYRNHLLLDRGRFRKRLLLGSHFDPDPDKPMYFYPLSQSSRYFNEATPVNNPEIKETDFSFVTQELEDNIIGRSLVLDPEYGYGKFQCAQTCTSACSGSCGSTCSESTRVGTLAYQLGGTDGGSVRVGDNDSDPFTGSLFTGSLRCDVTLHTYKYISPYHNENPAPIRNYRGPYLELKFSNIDIPINVSNLHLPDGIDEAYIGVQVGIEFYAQLTYTTSYNSVAHEYTQSKYNFNFWYGIDENTEVNYSGSTFDTLMPTLFGKYIRGNDTVHLTKMYNSKYRDDSTYGFPRNNPIGLKVTSSDLFNTRLVTDYAITNESNYDYRTKVFNYALDQEESTPNSILSDPATIYIPLLDKLGRGYEFTRDGEFDDIDVITYLEKNSLRLVLNNVLINGRLAGKLKNPFELPFDGLWKEEAGEEIVAKWRFWYSWDPK